jgi:pre-mRNA-splicing factor RBM22/SLT11
LCETCLGQNPYVRMIKLPYGHKLCKISGAPYQGFRWKAGPQGRYKETIISRDVATHKNICQTCLNDMKYGVPVGVRDAMLAQDESQRIKAPASNIGSQYFYTQVVPAADATPSTSNFSLDVANQNASTQLTAFSQSVYRPSGKSKDLQVTPASSVSPWQEQNTYKTTAFRNLPKLCSFWLNGTCNRVLRNTCPFRPCCGCFAFPEIASTDKETCAKLIDDLTTSGPAVVMKSLDSAIRALIHKSLKGNRDDAIRARVSGEDDMSKRYLNRLKSMNADIEPPSDTSIKTLWLGNIDFGAVTQQQLYDAIYSSGHIVNVQCFPAGNFAFIEYASREQAELAASGLCNGLYLLGRKVHVNWAKPKLQGAVTATTNGSDIMPMLAPPGMENAPANMYALANMPIPVIPTAPPPPPPNTPHPSMGIPAETASTGSGKRKFDDDGKSADESTKRKAEPSGSSLYPSMDPNRLGSS